MVRFLTINSQAQILTSPASIEQYNKVNDEILPELRQLLRVDTSQKNQDRMIELLQTLSGLCILVLESGAVEPNKQNQHMLDNFGMCLHLYVYSYNVTVSVLLYACAVSVCLCVCAVMFMIVCMLLSSLNIYLKGLISEILSYALSKGLEHQQSTVTEQDTGIYT